MKKNALTKILSVMLLVSMLLGMLPAAAMAAGVDDAQTADLPEEAAAEPAEGPAEEPEETGSTIAEALAGEAGAEYSVKGVVTLVDGRTVFVQDATGGICLYLAAADSSIALGDTLLGTGKLTSFNGLPELENATVQKAEGLSLSAKDTTIGALKTADVCAYVKISGLKVSAVSGRNITVKDAAGASIEICNAVVGDFAPVVGDKLDFTGAVGIVNGTLQLRNTTADELTITIDTEEAPAPTEKPQETKKEIKLEKLEEAPEQDSRLIIYHSASHMVMTDRASGVKLGGFSALPADGAITLTETMAYLIVSVNDKQQYSFELDEDQDGKADGKVLTAGETGSSLGFAQEKDSDLARWTLEQQEDGAWVLTNVGANDKDHKEQALEFFGDAFTTYEAKSDNVAYAFDFYAAAEDEPVKPAAPTAEPAAGEVEKGTEIKFSCETEGAVISYSTDSGATWTEGSSYTVTEDVTIQLKATLEGEDSEIVTLSYTVKAEPVKPAAPTAEPAAGEVEKGTELKFSCETEGAVISYSTDSGATWTEGSSYTVTEDVTIQLKATLEGEDSEIVTLSYTVKADEPETLAAPTADPAPGEIAEGTGIALSCETEGAVIKYHIGGEPDESTEWQEYTAPIVLEDDDTIYAKAVKDDEESEVVSFAYTIKREAPAAPTADPASGSEVEKGATVTLSCEKDGAIIYYYVEGVDDTGETPNWHEFEEPIVINEDTVIHAYAEYYGNPSEKVTFTYTVKEEAAKPAAPKADPAPGVVDEGTEVKFSCETEGAEIYYSTDGGKSWVKGSSFTVKEDVELQVKAIKDGAESDVVTFRYRVRITPDGEPMIITLDPNGGKISTTRVKVGADGVVPSLPSPQDRDGYVFAGWYDAKEGGSEIEEGDVISESITLYARWYELRSVVGTDVSVPDALKSRYSSVDTMKSAMLKTIMNRLAVTSVKGNQLYEVTVEYNDGSSWKRLPADLFPTKGVQVTMTMPSAVGTKDKITALHLFGEDCNGHKAGEGEMPTVTKSGTTLSFTVHGTSPLLLVWTSSSSGGTPSGGGGSAKTGDEAHMGQWIGSMVLSAAALGTVAWFALRRKKARG